MEIKLGEFCEQHSLDVEETYSILKNNLGDLIDKGPYAGVETATFSDKHMEEVLQILDVQLSDDSKESIQQDIEDIKGNIRFVTTTDTIDGYEIKEYFGPVAGAVSYTAG